MRLKTEFRNRSLQAAQNTEIAASSTPIGVHFSFEILGFQTKFYICFTHILTSNNDFLIRD